MAVVTAPSGDVFAGAMADFAKVRERASLCLGPPREKTSSPSALAAWPEKSACLNRMMTEGARDVADWCLLRSPTVRPHDQRYPVPFAKGLGPTTKAER